MRVSALHTVMLAGLRKIHSRVVGAIRQLLRQLRTSTVTRFTVLCHQPAAAKLESIPNECCPALYCWCAVLCYPVSRFVCRSELYEFDLTIDINIDIYPLKVRQRTDTLGGFVLLAKGQTSCRIEQLWCNQHTSRRSANTATSAAAQAHACSSQDHHQRHRAGCK